MDNNVTTLLHIPWTDVVHKNILPYLSLSDLFHLRSMSKSYKDLVDSYFVICLQLNLAINRRINKDGLQVIFENCRRVKYLNLVKCDWLIDDSLAEFLARNKCIIDINLSFCPNVDTKAMIALALNCKGLTSLRLAGCEWLSTESIIALTQHQKNLQIVDLAKCVLLSEPCIQEFVIKFTKLRMLSLAFIPSVTDATLDTIAQYCAALANLNIDGCKITRPAIKTLVLKCPKLESVKMSGVWKMKKRIIKSFT